MATLTLDKVWINHLPDGAAVSANSAIGRTLSHEIDGEVRTYAGGRRRAVATVGRMTTFEFVLRSVTTTTIDTLQSWLGETVQVRDARGQLYVGVFFSIDVAEFRVPTLYDVAVSLRVVDPVEV